MDSRGNDGLWSRRRAISRPAVVGVLLAAGSAAAADVQYTLIGRTDARVRSGLAGDRAKTPDGGVALATGEVELLPSGEAVLGLDSTQVSLLYNPSILLREPQASGPVVVLHRGRAGLGTRWEGGSFLLTEDGAYGEADISTLRNPEAATAATGTAIRAGSILRAEILPYARSATSANLELALPQRVSLGFSAGYRLAGSLPNDAGIRDPLPFQYGPYGAVRARVGVTDLDSLSATAQIMHATFVYGAEQLLAEASVTWDRQVSRTVTTSLSAGAAYARQHVCTIFTDPDGGTAERYCELPTPVPENWDRELTTPGWYESVFPVVSAAASWRASMGQGSPIVASAGVRLAPFADSTTGVVYERIEGRLQGDWSPARTVVLRAIGSGAYATRVGGPGEQSGDQLYSGEGVITWTPEQWFSVMASARIIWLAQPRLGNPGRLDWAGTVSVILRAHDTLGW